MRKPSIFHPGALLLALAATAPLALAQNAPNPRPAPQWVLNALHLNAGTVQDLQIRSDRTRFVFDVVVGGQLRTVELEPNDVRTPGFQLLVDDGNGISQVPTPPSTTWIGQVQGLPESRVAASIIGGLMGATISLDAHDHEVWGIESVHEMDPALPRTEHIVYTTHDANNAGISCGTDESHWQPIGQPGLDILRMEAQIAIDCDLEFYQRNGSNVTSTQNRATSIVNGMDVIYRRDIDVQYAITTIIVRTARTYVNTNMSNLLSEFRSRWNSRHGSVQRDLAHLFTGKGTFSGVVGIAWVGVVCNTSYAYGVDKAFASLGTNIGLVSHEAGHNWNARHCDGYNPCNIMCAGLGGCSRNISAFAPVSINTIVNFKNSRGCLSSPTVRPVLTGISPSSVAVRPAQTITLTGTGFAGVTTVNIGSIQVPPTGNTGTQITFPSPLPAAFGTLPVTVTNQSGTSNALNLSFTQVSQELFVAPTLATSFGGVPFAMAGDPDDNWWIIASFNDGTTFPFLGFNVLQNSLVLTQGQLSPIGVHEFIYRTPVGLSLAGLQLHSQAVMIENVSPALTWISPPIRTIFSF